MEEIRTPILPLQLRARTDGIMYISLVHSQPPLVHSTVSHAGRSCKRHKLDALSVVGGRDHLYDVPVV